MEAIPNNHPGCIKALPTGAGFLPSTVSSQRLEPSQLGTSDFRSGVEMHGIRRRIDAGGTSRKAAEEGKIADLHKELNTTIYYYILWFLNFNFKLCFFFKCW